MFDVIAHKEGAKLLQKCFSLEDGGEVWSSRDVKRKNPAFFMGTGNGFS